MNHSTSAENHPSPPEASGGPVPFGDGDPRVPLLNLAAVSIKMDSVQQFLSQSLSSNTLLSKHQMDMVSTEIGSAIHQIMVNGAALLACSHGPSSDPQ